MDSAQQFQLNDQLIQAVLQNNSAFVKTLVADGADINCRDSKSGLTSLAIASGFGYLEMVKLLLELGANVFVTDSKAGLTPLHKACQRGDLAVVTSLVEAGSFVDAQAYSTGHTPLIDAIWYKWPDIVEYLLEKNAGLNIVTHYGFTLMEHFDYALNVSQEGKDKLLQIKKLLDARSESDQNKIKSQRLMKAVEDNSLADVKKAIENGAELEVRYPVLNGFNDMHTPLLVASRDGHTDIVDYLIRAGADVNVVEPTFGAVPLHKATYNGHADITRLLCRTSGINLDFQGLSNGYTPLHDALWHGYVECSETLIEAGANLNIIAHDGKSPLAVAIDSFGENGDIVNYLKSKL